jgi:hypothetical protein
VTVNPWEDFSMGQTDVFALQNTGMGTFLFAEVGTESNGSMLTVLSVLARLGRDPWAQAAQWSRLPKAEIIDRLANCIAQMPMPPQALRDARETAARLILLLPTSASASNHSAGSKAVLPTLPRWALAVLIVVMLAFSILGTQPIGSGAKDVGVATGVRSQPLSSSVPSD